jgi:hypothetical protein
LFCHLVLFHCFFEVFAVFAEYFVAALMVFLFAVSFLTVFSYLLSALVLFSAPTP